MFKRLKEKLFNNIVMINYFAKYSGMVSFSQYGEDKVLDFALKILINKGVVTNLNYLDIGGCLPYSSSNSYFLYRQGYSGVVIEADPLLAKSFKKARQKDVVLNLGIIPENENKDLPFYYADGVCGSFDKENVLTAISKHNLNSECKSINIPTSTVNEILEKYFTNEPLILLSIDVEGLDEKIIKSIDFRRFSPYFLCVETAGLSSDKFLGNKCFEIIEFLKSKGYIVYSDSYINTIFIRKDILEKMY